MQKIEYNYSLTETQQLFVEKGLELLYKNTLDTFRLRLHNPKSIIQELSNVCKEARDGLLTNNEYAVAASNEAKLLLKPSTDGLVFQSINREYFIDLIKSPKAENHNRIIQASNLLLQENADYCNSLFHQIETLLSKTEEELSEIDRPKELLNSLTHYLCVELTNLGYTKQYLHHFFRTIFVHINDGLSFDDRFNIWKGLGSPAHEKYAVLYHILGDSFQFPEFEQIDSEYELVNKKYRSLLPDEISESVKRFIEDKKVHNLISLKVEALDHYKAVELSRARLTRDLDLYHLGFNKGVLKIDSQCAVIGEVEPSKSSTAPTNYQIDGFIRSSPRIFRKLLEKINRMKSGNVESESIDKVLSAMRYLRTGSESPELETKLLNYWIGLEYIFTSFNDSEKTIDRLKKYYPICHALIYPRRNLYDFHKAIDRIGISDRIPDYDHNLEYLANFGTYEAVIRESQNQLMIYRAKYYQEWVSNSAMLTKRLFQHKQNLEWNIIRLYRIRNEIVHNAAVKNSIYSNVSHLKYYLTFILNSILNHFSQIPEDFSPPSKLTIEDYFISQDIMLGSLKNKTLRDYIKVHNPMQILN